MTKSAVTALVHALASTRNVRVSTQPREQATGQYAFEGDWGRKCVCGHELGVHTAEAPHECMNSDRRHMYCPAQDQAWFDQSIEPTPCDCIRFRPTRKRVQSGR